MKDIFPQYDSINVLTLNVEAKEGSTVGECLRECIILSATYWVNVELKHKDRIYTIPINDLLLVGSSEPSES